MFPGKLLVLASALPGAFVSLELEGPSDPLSGSSAYLLCASANLLL